MRVDGIIYADDRMIDDIRNDPPLIVVADNSHLGAHLQPCVVRARERPV